MENIYFSLFVCRVSYYLLREKTKQNTIEKYKKSGVNVLTDFKSHSERDTAMTKASDYDIAWVRSKEEAIRLYGNSYKANKKSGTEQNLDRRIKLNKKQI